jgi:transcription elongation GreA/GreB family factor
MSVAFTKEEDSEAAAADLPDRPISAEPNFVTASGLALLDAQLDAAKAAYAAAQTGESVSADRTAMARATRDLRYYSARRASAQLIEAGEAKDRAAFGSRVTIEREDGRVQTFRIVGEDEADPSQGSVSYVSPLARAVAGKEVGEVFQLAGAEVELVAIS